MVMNKALYSVEEVLESNGGILPMSKSGVYRLIRANEIPAKRIGRRVFVLGSYIHEIVEGKPSATQV